jgi:aminopeptidase N
MLAVDLRNRDPLDAFTEVPYEKGRLFLSTLDAKFGRERFDEFLRSYFDHFAFQSVTTAQFVAYLAENLLNRYPGIVTESNVEEWLTTPGIPADAVLPATDAWVAVDNVRTLWLSGALQGGKLATQPWDSQQWVYFLKNMPPSLSVAQLKDLDQALSRRSGNAEIEQSWLLLVIRNHYQPAYAHLEHYLQTMGNGRLILPLYRELMKTPAGAAQARRVYRLAQPSYHPQTATAVAAIVDPEALDGESADE